MNVLIIISLWVKMIPCFECSVLLSGIPFLVFYYEVKLVWCKTGFLRFYIIKC